MLCTEYSIRETSIPFKGMVGNDLMLYLHGCTPALPDSWAPESAPQAKRAVCKKIDSTVHFYSYIELQSKEIVFKINTIS
jgi:hypothetical protein